MYYLFRTVDKAPVEVLDIYLGEDREGTIRLIRTGYPNKVNLALYFFTMTDEGGVMVEVSLDD